MLHAGGFYAIFGLIAAGALVGRKAALLLPVAATVVDFVGLHYGWWGGGLLWPWWPQFLAELLAALALTSLGLLGRLGAKRLAWRLRMTPRRGLGPAVVVALFLAASGAYGYVSTRPADLGEVKAAGTPAYFPGSSFEGLRLEHAESDGVKALLVYGDCDVPVGGIDPGGCSPPLQLQISPLLARSPLLYSSNTRCTRFTFGGVPAANFQTGGLDVYVGRVTIAIFGDWAFARRAASTLRPLEPESSTAQLPQPPRWVYRALERCRLGGS